MSDAQKRELWDRWKPGESINEISRALGRPRGSIFTILTSNGGYVPPVQQRQVGQLTLHERESTSRGLDAFVVVTPEYNHGFPAVLKNRIDWHYAEWRTKPVGFVSYSGVCGGLRAAEQLRQVSRELHAVAIRDVVSLHNASQQFDEAGALTDPAGPSAAAESLLDQLSGVGVSGGR
ncbi:NADPH-dependent FMN reductase [Streptomyces silvisoli]|uniref:NAD(P)H-dependent oxidoreductase n=1 Tax=Streptomyces silvisoli TaxID=3034235 RepID=A0ABT5ZU50_9ACTN|nr:NAD(P)H-dependent oxidoreductase [Streptomyces silvisoli]MDF3293355.1 NAD(P)H-dependent oxidoreductase [Streptomyces silvisoli]